MLFYITGGAPQAVPRTACLEANRTACIEVYCSSGRCLARLRHWEHDERRSWGKTGARWPGRGLGVQRSRGELGVSGWIRAQVRSSTSELWTVQDAGARTERCELLWKQRGSGHKGGMASVLACVKWLPVRKTMEWADEEHGQALAERVVKRNARLWETSSRGRVGMRNDVVDERMNPDSKE